MHTSFELPIPSSSISASPRVRPPPKGLRQQPLRVELVRAGAAQRRSSGCTTPFDSFSHLPPRSPVSPTLLTLCSPPPPLTPRPSPRTPHPAQTLSASVSFARESYPTAGPISIDSWLSSRSVTRFVLRGVAISAPVCGGGQLTCGTRDGETEDAARVWRDSAGTARTRGAKEGEHGCNGVTRGHGACCQSIAQNATLARSLRSDRATHLVVRLRLDMHGDLSWLVARVLALGRAVDLGALRGSAGARWGGGGCSGW